MRVYIAGKLNDNAVGYIQNCARMIEWGEKVRKAGFAVFVPCLDVLSGLHSGDLGYEDYFENSQEWLDASDAVFLVPGWQASEGTKKEILRANTLDVPVFDCLGCLVEYREQMK